MRRLVAIAGAVALAAALVLPASAGTFLSNGWRGKAPVTITLINVSVTDHFLVQGITEAAANWSKASAVEVVVGGRGKNKVYLYESAYGTNFCMACTSLQGSTYTTGASIFFNDTLMTGLDNLGVPGYYKRGIVCHEVGHALGLDHVEDPSIETCMQPGGNYDHPALSDFDHLAALYGG